MALEYAGIEPTDLRVAIYKSILILEQPFSYRDIQKRASLNGRTLSLSSITSILILFRQRKIVQIAREEKSKGRGRPRLLYTGMI